MPSARPVATATARGFRIWRGSAYTVVACSPSASWTPIESKIVPRPAGSTSVSRCCACASRPNDEARTAWIQAARASRSPNAATRRSNSSRMRRLTSFGTKLPPGQIQVARVLRGRRDETHAAGGDLDPRRGGVARQLRLQRRVLRVQVRLLLAQPVEAHVQAQYGDVERDHPGEQDAEDDDPADAARERPPSRGDTAARSR